MNSYHRIRDSYHASVWLTAEAFAFLDSQFPSDEPEVAISKLIDRQMRQAREKPRSIPVGERMPKAPKVVEVIPALMPLTPSPDPVSAVKPKPVATAPTKPKPSQRPKVSVPQKAKSNPIGALQEICQAEGVDLPDYEFQECKEGFWCEVSVLGLTTTGVGKNKATAKRDAAIGLLELLGG